MREKLDTGDTQARKAFLQSVISEIEVDDDKVKIIGDKATLAAVIAGHQAAGPSSRFCTQMARPKRFRTPDPQIRSLTRVFENSSEFAPTLHPRCIGTEIVPFVPMGNRTHPRPCRHGAS